MNLIDCYLNYCKVLKLELKTRQTSKQTNIQTNKELKNWGASSLRRKRNSRLSGPILQCMTNVCMFSQSSQSLPVTIKIVKIWLAACNAMYCNVTQARCPTLVWHWQLTLNILLTDNGTYTDTENWLHIRDCPYITLYIIIKLKMIKFYLCKNRIEIELIKF